MRFTVSICQDHFEKLYKNIMAIPQVEGAAYLLCGRSSTANETRLLVNDVIPVAEEHYLIREELRLSIDSRSYASVAKRAQQDRQSIIFVHSHPGGYAEFSGQDNVEDPKLHEFFAARVPDGPHASIVVCSPESMFGRIWRDGEWQPIDRIRVIGDRFQFIDNAGNSGATPIFFDRQVRAFGEDMQKCLAKLHIGIVGVGGTGSAVVEQLVRLGVGEISIFEGDRFEKTNVNRVYGSNVRDDGKLKADISFGHLNQIGLGTKINIIPKHITVESAAKLLRRCDIVFGCTDTHRSRGILVQLAIRYLIPVIDVAVKISSDDGKIRSVDGRVTILIPGEACLFCRERTSPEIIALEALSPEEQKALADEGYAPELQTNNPAVISFTTAVASQAVNFFLHRMTGFMGSDRKSSEILMRFHDLEIRTNRPAANPTCACAQRKFWGRGDSRDFLGLTWAG